jgi:hypothetical protein
MRPLERPAVYSSEIANERSTVLIDLHDAHNRESYASRDADPGWMDVVRDIIAPAGRSVLDIGCGGGIYSRAWRQLSAAAVIGVDVSAAMVDAARDHCAGMDGLAFLQGDARAAGLPDDCADVVFERALIHHIRDCQRACPRPIGCSRPTGRALCRTRRPKTSRRRKSMATLAATSSSDFPACSRSSYVAVPLVETCRGRSSLPALRMSASTASSRHIVSTSPLPSLRTHFACALAAPVRTSSQTQRSKRSSTGCVTVYPQTRPSSSGSRGRFGGAAVPNRRAGSDCDLAGRHGPRLLQSVRDWPPRR